MEEIIHIEENPRILLTHVVAKDWKNYRPFSYVKRSDESYRSGACVITRLRIC
jgi:hypothetical protein